MQFLCPCSIERPVDHERPLMKSLVNQDVVFRAKTKTSWQSGNDVSTTEPAGPIHACDIGKTAWPAFCHWITTNLGGVVATLARDEGPDRRMVECLECPLERVDAVSLANGVAAVKITMRVKQRSHIFEVPAPSWLRLHYNAAGFVTVLEIGYEQGKMALRFAGSPPLGRAFTANSWGE